VWRGSGGFAGADGRILPPGPAAGWLLHLHPPTGRTRWAPFGQSGAAEAARTYKADSLSLSIESLSPRSPSPLPARLSSLETEDGRDRQGSLELLATSAEQDAPTTDGGATDCRIVSQHASPVQSVAASRDMSAM